MESIVRVKTVIYVTQTGDDPLVDGKTILNDTKLKLCKRYKINEVTVNNYGV